MPNVELNLGSLFPSDALSAHRRGRSTQAIGGTRADLRLRRARIGGGQHAGSCGRGAPRLVDRDFLELNNLQRQVLYDEDDVAAGWPKVGGGGSQTPQDQFAGRGRSVVADVDPRNIRALVDGVDVILDGTDNFETRFLLNDAALQIRHSLGLRRLHRHRRPDHDDPARRDAVSAVLDARSRHRRAPRPRAIRPGSSVRS